MESLPCKGCKGLCCGPVAITNHEFKIIKKQIRLMPIKKRLELKNQKRHYRTCIFYDIYADRCGIHSVRPAVCRAFGYHENLVCFRKPQSATMGNWFQAEKPVGILTIDITWKDF